MDILDIDTSVKRTKAKILGITSISFETNKGWIKKGHCIYAHPPYLGQRIWVRENRLFKI